MAKKIKVAVKSEGWILQKAFGTMMEICPKVYKKSFGRVDAEKSWSVTRKLIFV